MLIDGTKSKYCRALANSSWIAQWSETLSRGGLTAETKCRKLWRRRLKAVSAGVLPGPGTVMGPGLRSPADATSPPTDDGHDDERELERLLREPVTSLDLPLKVGHTLTDAGIDTVRELVSYSGKELLAIEGFGMGSLSAVEVVLSDAGLSLAREDTGAS